MASRSHAARSSRFRSTASYRDRKDIAIAAVEYLKRKFPHSERW
jgi:hypothetical protein